MSLCSRLLMGIKKMEDYYSSADIAEASDIDVITADPMAAMGAILVWRVVSAPI